MFPMFHGQETMPFAMPPGVGLPMVRPANPQTITMMHARLERDCNVAVAHLAQSAAGNAYQNKGGLLSLGQAAQCLLSNEAVHERQLVRSQGASLEVQSNRAAFRAFGDLLIISDYLTTCNPMVGARCREIIKGAVQHMDGSPAGMAAAIGLAEGATQMSMIWAMEGA